MKRVNGDGQHVVRAVSVIAALLISAPAWADGASEGGASPGILGVGPTLIAVDPLPPLETCDTDCGEDGSGLGDGSGGDDALGLGDGSGVDDGSGGDGSGVDDGSGGYGTETGTTTGDGTDAGDGVAIPMEDPDCVTCGVETMGASGAGTPPVAARHNAYHGQVLVLQHGPDLCQTPEAALTWLCRIQAPALK